MKGRAVLVGMGWVEVVKVEQKDEAADGRFWRARKQLSSWQVTARVKGEREARERMVVRNFIVRGRVLQTRF